MQLAALGAIHKHLLFLATNRPRGFHLQRRENFSSGCAWGSNQAEHARGGLSRLCPTRLNALLAKLNRVAIGNGTQKHPAKIRTAEGEMFG